MGRETNQARPIPSSCRTASFERSSPTFRKDAIHRHSFLGEDSMKSVIAASLAVLIGAGSVAAIGAAPASAAAVVVKVGVGHHHWRGGHWMWHGRYWGHRSYACHRWHHRRACAWRYW
jgi:hypothetical protein